MQSQSTPITDDSNFSTTRRKVAVLLGLLGVAGLGVYGYAVLAGPSWVMTLANMIGLQANLWALAVISGALIGALFVSAVTVYRQTPEIPLEQSVSTRSAAAAAPENAIHPTSKNVLGISKNIELSRRELLMLVVSLENKSKDAIGEMAAQNQMILLLSYPSPNAAEKGEKQHYRFNIPTDAKALIEAMDSIPTDSKIVLNYGSIFRVNSSGQFAQDYLEQNNIPYQRRPLVAGAPLDTMLPTDDQNFRTHLAKFQPVQRAQPLSDDSDSASDDSIPTPPLSLTPR